MAAGGFAFGPFELDSARRRLTAAGEPVAISDRHLDILLSLVANAGRIIAKDDLIQAGWRDVAVGDNSLEQAISSLRRTLGAPPGGGAYIDTVARRGYRFAAAVTRQAARESDEALDALLAPHRAFVEGRTALESFDPAQVTRALAGFEEAVRVVPDDAVAHVGLATACVMRFEMTRADPAPDRDALARAARHAREACRLDPQSAEAWATLGFVLAQTGDRIHQVDAIAALQRATSLEPSNWRHHFRLASVSWGEARLRAAQHTLALLPGFPLAHWMAATVYVARQLLDEAERELSAGLAHGAERAAGRTPFGSVALFWLRGLIHLARGDEARALADFEQELAVVAGAHLYARECATNTWYAIGAVRHRQGRAADARAAFRQALTLIPAHPMALTALGLTERLPADGLPPMIAALARAAHLSVTGAHADAGVVVDEALAAAPPGNAAWFLPVEPILAVSTRPGDWAAALARLSQRAA